MAKAIGQKIWAIAEGYIPGQSHGPHHTMVSHEALCFLNTGDRDAQILVTVYFKDLEPLGPYRFTVPARRTLHQRLNDLKDPHPIPRDTDYACLIESTEPVVVQHTRLDSRQAENALMTTIAYSSGAA